MKLIDADNFSNEFNSKIFNKLQNEYLNSTADDKTKDVADFVTSDIMTVFNDLIDNAPTVTVEPEKVLVANVTFDNDKLKEIVNTEVIEKIKNGELVICDEWIPVSERLPNDLEPVNITWINHCPEPYYKEIKDKPFTATGVYFNGQWYWWSTLCTDILAEYSHNFDDVIDSSIEVIAWQPLPEPYHGEDMRGKKK